MSDRAPETVLLDDGELADLGPMLEELGVEATVVRGSAAGPVPRPARLLLVTARRAQGLAQAAVRAGGDWTAACAGEGAGRPASLVVTDQDSPTVRALLREVGFDVLVRRPLHPTVMRLLVARALYVGPERRTSERVPLGESVTYWTGSQRRNAVLTDLSLRGGRLATRYGARRGIRLRLELDGAGPDGGRLDIEGRVVRCRAGGEGARPRELSLALEFAPLPTDVAEALTHWLDARACAAEPGGTPSPGAPRRAPAEAPLREAHPQDRRRHRRGSYFRPVTMVRDEASRTLLGHDLSVSGMRLEPHPDLAVGETVRLAIYGHSREEPSIVEAVVVRNDGPRGVALRFDGLAAVVERRIEAIVAALPSVEALADGEADSMGSVVAQLLRA